MTVREEAIKLAAKFEIEWGGFRRFISANPLTGFWVGAGAGALFGAFLVWVS